MNKATHSIAAAIQHIQTELRSYENRYSRDPGSVQLLAVSKRKPVSAIREAIAAGQRAFGENYVDEALEKISAIADDTLQWHFIGAIQSRKCADIAQHFHWAHGVDRFKVANRLSASRPSDMSPLNVCLQVNLDNEAGKAGVAIEQLHDLAQQCASLPGIRVRGLMAIPAPRTELDDQREVFSRLSTALTQLQSEWPQMDTLSMGMSADMEAAVAEGATIVRIGTALFGAREPAAESR